jgi:hypothetical protein
MSNIAEFIEVRKGIETLAVKIVMCIEQNEIQDSRQHLDEANRHLELLKTMVDNDVQVIAAGRLTRHLADLGTKIAKMGSKPLSVKRAAVKKLKAPLRPERKEEPVIVVYERP